MQKLRYSEENILEKEKLSWQLEVNNSKLYTQRILNNYDQLNDFVNFFPGDSLEFKGELGAQNSKVNFNLDSKNSWGNFWSVWASTDVLHATSRFLQDNGVAFN